MRHAVYSLFLLGAVLFFSPVHVRAEAETVRILRQASMAYEAKDYAQTAELLLPLAEKNNSDASFVLGLLAARGEGQTRNLLLAENWWKKSADGGNSLAQFNLGYLYFKGGTPDARNLVKTRELWSKAARQKQADALFGLGVLQANGLGGPTDMTGAVASYQGATALGHPMAEYELGMAYLEGKGVKADKKKAKNCFSRAAARGIAEAGNALDSLNAEEKGTEKGGTKKKPVR